MYTTNKYFKPILKLLELVFVVAIIWFLAEHFAELARKNHVYHDKWDMPGLGEFLLGLITIIIYYLVWNVRIFNVIAQEKRRDIKLINVGLLLLIPAIFAIRYLIGKINDEITESKGEKLTVTVPFKIIFKTPNNIMGFRMVPDSIFFWTHKSKIINPDRKYTNDDEYMWGLSFNHERIEGSEDLFAFSHDKVTRIDYKSRNLNERDYYHKGGFGCLQAYTNPENWDVYRYDWCQKIKYETPILVGYESGYRGIQYGYQVDDEMIFATLPRFIDAKHNNLFYIARINNRFAKVYTLDLGADKTLVREFKNNHAHFHVYGNSEVVYLVGRNRILEVLL